jgi:hypothetical protein
MLSNVYLPGPAASLWVLSWRLVDARLQAMYLASTGRSVGSNMLREC